MPDDGNDEPIAFFAAGFRAWYAALSAGSAWKVRGMVDLAPDAMGARIGLSYRLGGGLGHGRNSKWTALRGSSMMILRESKHTVREGADKNGLGTRNNGQECNQK
ncbi:hypothetical protein GCM10011491_30520 [Brucella endophytica]|uniref:Porin family protein n=1 Tax=Brucella endophytica TaxID=1963359 RepID=A0A916SK26_9HYPH|nr:hypothetical protein GCM10011491_30520 [Brucella endophytica]